MASKYISGSEVKVGDTFPGFGQVIALRPYTGPLVDVLGEGARIAQVFGGREITVPGQHAVQVSA